MVVAHVALDGNAPFADALAALRMEAEFAAPYGVAEGFVIYLAVNSIESEPFVLVPKRISDRPEHASGLPINDVVGSAGNRTCTCIAGKFGSILMVIQARKRWKSQSAAAQRTHFLAIQFKGAFEHGRSPSKSLNRESTKEATPQTLARTSYEFETQRIRGLRA